MRKVILVDCNVSSWKAGKFTKHSCLEPLGIEYLGKMVQQNGYQVKILQQRELDRAKILKKVLEYSPDIVGISSMANGFNIAKYLAEQIKMHNHKVVTIYGGVHPSSNPQDIIGNGIDITVIGEGEYTFIELLKALDSSDNISKVDGIAYCDDGLKITKPRRRIENLDKIPFPLRDKSLLKDCKIYALMYPPPSEQENVCQILYSRGCTYNCSFCSSPNVWGNEVKYRSPQNVVAEIRDLQEQFNTNTLFFTDLTFNLNRKKVYALCDEILKQRIKIIWMAMCNLRGNKELFKKMRLAGCTKIGFGIESPIYSSRRKLRKNENMQRIRETLEASNSIGIINRGYIMIGYPWDTKESIEHTFSILKNLQIDELKVSFFTPMPGTQAYQEFKSLLLTYDFSKYTTDEPILKIEGLSPIELIELRKAMVRDFYLSTQYEERRKKKSMRHPYLKKSYDDFFCFLYQKGIVE